ncbi:hypothetical protein ACVNP0_06755 [Staphylococcus aureus]
MIKATGGFAKSEVTWIVQIYLTQVNHTESYESSCLGACVLGLKKAVGDIEDFSIVSSMVGATNKLFCTIEDVRCLPRARIHYQFKSFFNREYEQIADFQRQHMAENKTQ